MSLTDQTPDQLGKARVSPRNLALMAIFTALSVVGGYIIIPSPVGTIGLDSAPGYFSAIAFGPGIGFIVIALGHLIGAARAGFPMTLPIHAAIAAGLGICALVFRALGRRGGVWLVIAVVAATVLNSFGLGLIVVPTGGGWALYAAVLPSLLVGSAINLVIAAVAYRLLGNSKLLK